MVKKKKMKSAGKARFLASLILKSFCARKNLTFNSYFLKFNKFAVSMSISIRTLAKENGLNQNYVQNGSIMILG